VPAAGSKNAALPILAAALLCEGETRLLRLPDLQDIATMRSLLAALGGEFDAEGGLTADAKTGAEQDAELEAGGSVTVRTRRRAPPAGWGLRFAAQGPTEAPYEIVRRMRASICVLGPLLARRGRARVPLPGGCVFGPRPVDLHVRGMEALGARVTLDHGVLDAEAPPGGLRGARVPLRSAFGSTVLGTANVLMAATLARGETVIEGAAKEPEVIGLARWLRACGAIIEGEGTDEIRVQGVAGLNAVPVQIPPDRIETGTLLLAAAMTRGRVRVTGVRCSELAPLVRALRESGVPVHEGEDWIEVDARGANPAPTDLTTEPFPGFPTDLQAQWTAYATTVHGVSRITDAIYPERFMHVPELQRMGANISREGNAALVEGPSPLAAAPVVASDLRASAALVMAGLVASGTTIVRRVYHLDRGYEALERKLSLLGGRVERTLDTQKP
jgi:UDP-N-acetylglucosamine 1-carboxyvinyltransferase